MAEVPEEPLTGGILCEDMEERVIQRNIDYELDQHARCALEMAVHSFNGGQLNLTDLTVIEVADKYFDWLMKRSGRQNDV